MDKVLKDAMRALNDNRPDEAETLVRSVLPANYENGWAWYVLGLCALKRDNAFGGIALIEKALALQPNNAEAHQNLGVVQSRLGRFDQAIAHWRAAARLNPRIAECYQYLAEVKALPIDSREYTAAKALADDDQADPERRRGAAFAVANALQDDKSFAEAFAYFALGNQLNGATSDVPAERALLELSREVFNADLFATLGDVGVRTAPALFVVGMPRSGTTLVEQVLASHSQVTAAGELGDIAGIAGSLGKIRRGIDYPRALRELPAATLRKALRDFAGQYTRRLATFDPQARYVVDKAPGNYRFLGLIALLFPTAKIIHCQRAPLDVGLSCFQANFANGQPWSFSLAGIADKLESYGAFMRFWHEVLPIPVLDVSYEALVANPEQEARRMIAYCGLDWQEQCVRPHENSGQVSTASKWQVRQPINRGSVERWRRYESELEPLRQALAATSAALPGPAQQG